MTGVKTLSSLQLCFNPSFQLKLFGHLSVIFVNMWELYKKYSCLSQCRLFSAYIWAVRLQFQSRDGVGRKGGFRSGESLL